LCWVHAERLIHKLDTFTDKQYVAQRPHRRPALRCQGADHHIPR